MGSEHSSYLMYLINLGLFGVAKVFSLVSYPVSQAGIPPLSLLTRQHKENEA